MPDTSPAELTKVKSLERLRNLIAPIAQLAGLVAVVVGVTIWGIRLQDRVDGVEAKLNVLIATPSHSTEQSSQPGDNPANVLAQSCKTLADRFASAATSDDGLMRLGSRDIRELMAELGCIKK